MDDEKQVEKSDKYLVYLIIIAIGLVAISIAFPFVVNCFFSDWGKSGTFGDTFGALNALFSGLVLAGVIVTILIQKSELENQRTELQLQRIEMQETRKEFLISRITNLVYSQLDRFEKCLSELAITHNGITYKGNDAISFLDENKQTIYRSFDKPEDEFMKERKEAIIKMLKIYTPNKSQIEKFAHNAYNSIEVLKQLIYKTNIEIGELNDIKNLFFYNIGLINMGVIEEISNTAEQEIELLVIEDYFENNIELGTMMKANIFLKPIKTFYRELMTKDNFSKLKSEWIESRANEN